MESENKYKLCSHCGTRLDEDAKFCKACGQEITGRTAERKIFYEGSIYKCPNCGEVLDAFLTHCPACGYEIRNVRSSSSAREFTEKFEKIESKQMPVMPSSKSVMKKVFGRDLRDEDEAEEARRRFEHQKKQEKVALIINYPVPNTKEDLLEFMIMVTSNINVKEGIDDSVTKAWIEKLDQVYQRAEISMKDSSDFQQIKNMYDQKKKELRNKKNKSIYGTVAIVLICIFVLALLANPLATILLLITIAALLLIGFILFKGK